MNPSQCIKEKADENVSLVLEDLRRYIGTVAELSQESWLLLLETLVICRFHKEEYLLSCGDVCDSVFFLSQGYCRAFYDREGDECNTAFYFEHDFATNLKSLTRNEKSEYAIQACEDLVAVRFDRKKLLETYPKSQEIESFGRKLLELLVTRQEEYMKLFQLLTAQQRYEYLLKHQPQMIQRISLSRLSSYLGIARETLSRIRHKIKDS